MYTSRVTWPLFQSQYNTQYNLFNSDRCQSFLCKFILSHFVIPEIQFGAYQDDWCVWRVMMYFREPLRINKGVQ